MKLTTSKGTVEISTDVFTSVAGWAASSCFGVKGMATRTVADGIVHLLKIEAVGRGVKIRSGADDSIAVELHIIVEHGVNINAVCRSIISEVRYVVEKFTGVTVSDVTVFVDSIMTR